MNFNGLCGYPNIPMILNQQLYPFIYNELSKEKIFYVYVYMDPRKYGRWEYYDFIFEYEPFYIGKGKNDRLNKHIEIALQSNKKSKFLDRIREIIYDAEKPMIQYICKNLMEEDAYNLEENIIGNLQFNYKCLTNIMKNSFWWKKYEKKEFLNKKEISEIISRANIKYYKKHPERGKKQGEKIKGFKNGRWQRGNLTEGEKNGKYKKINENKLLELYDLKFNTSQIGKILNTSSSIPKNRLKKLNKIRNRHLKMSNKDFNFRQKLIEKFLKGEINYEQLIIERKEQINS